MLDASSPPKELEQRLLAAGVVDAASLQSALAADAELRRQYERWLVSLILQRFAATADEQALQALVEKVPFLLDEAMIEAIRSAVAHAERRGDDVNAQALNGRLQALLALKQQRRRAQKQGAIAKALLAFVQAGDENVAAAVFWQNRDILANDDAEALLINQFESQDRTAKYHLERRRQLLRALRTRWDEMRAE